MAMAARETARSTSRSSQGEGLRGSHEYISREPSSSPALGKDTYRSENKQAKETGVVRQFKGINGIVPGQAKQRNHISDLGTSAKVPGMATFLVSCLPRRRLLAAHQCHTFIGFVRGARISFVRGSR